MVINKQKVNRKYSYPRPLLLVAALSFTLLFSPKSAFSQTDTEESLGQLHLSFGSSPKVLTSKVRLSGLENNNTSIQSNLSTVSGLQFYFTPAGKPEKPNNNVYGIAFDAFKNNPDSQQNSNQLTSQMFTLKWGKYLGEHFTSGLNLVGGLGAVSTAYYDINKRYQKSTGLGTTLSLGYIIGIPWISNFDDTPGDGWYLSANLAYSGAYTSKSTIHALQMQLSIMYGGDMYIPDSPSCEDFLICPSLRHL